MVSELPPEFSPSIVTLSAPFRSSIGAPPKSALIVLATPPAGFIVIEMYEAPPDPLALSTIVFPSSKGLPQTSIVIVPVCVPIFIAAIAKNNVV